MQHALVTEIIKRHDLSLKKHLGQHFLTSEKIVSELIASANLSPDDVVLEIGAGVGALTVPLAQLISHVFAVEISPDLVRIFAAEHSPYQDKITLIQQDILSLTIKNLLNETPYKVIGAIPYNITSPILHKFLFEKHLPESMTLLIQKEVAEKIAAQPPRATYLSTLTALMGHATITKKTIPPGVFEPPPAVNSSIIHIVFDNLNPSVSPEVFSEFLHTAFAQPRKMLRSIYDVNTLTLMNIDPTARPQEITLEHFLKLYSAYTQ